MNGIFFPDIDFAIEALSGVNNRLDQIVILPFLDLDGAQLAGGDEDVILTMADVSGFAIKVFAHSTFVRDPATGILLQQPLVMSSSQVKFDKIPMPPPQGSTPLVVGTLQPGGVILTPPAQVIYPNAEGLAPGDVADVFAFHHDIGQFVNIGPATVSEDGDIVSSDPGFGIVQSGWHCLIRMPGPTANCQRDNRDDDNCEGINCEKDGQEPPPASPTPPRDCPDGDKPPSDNGEKPPPKDDDSPECDKEGKPGGGPGDGPSGADDDKGKQCEKSGDEGSDGSSAGSIDPVYLFSGEFYETVVDLRIRGRGLDFIWSRKYASSRDVNTAQGNGWDCSYNVFVEFLGEDVVVCDGNTRRDLFRLQADGSWSKRGFFREISQDVNGILTMVYADKGRWVFNALDGSPTSGKLASIIDRNGNQLTLLYDATGRLVAVTDTLDRDIQIAYNADGFIASVIDFAGRQVLYAYYQDGDADGSLGDLKSVTMPSVVGTPNGNDFPNGKTTVYTYTTGFVDERLNHDLLTITDPKGQTYVQNLYAHTIDPADSRHTLMETDLNFGRVVRQIWGNPNDVVDLVYVTQEPATSNNGAVIKCIVNDRMGNVTEYFYDSKNRGVLERVMTGRAAPDLPTTETGNRPINKLRFDDPDSFETRYFWNQDSQLKI